MKVTIAKYCLAGRRRTGARVTHFGAARAFSAAVAVAAVLRFAVAVFLTGRAVGQILSRIRISIGVGICIGIGVAITVRVAIGVTIRIRIRIRIRVRIRIPGSRFAVGFGTGPRIGVIHHI